MSVYFGHHLPPFYVLIETYSVRYLDFLLLDIKAFIIESLVCTTYVLLLFDDNIHLIFLDGTEKDKEEAMETDDTKEAKVTYLDKIQ